MAHKITAATQIQSAMVDRWYREGKRATAIIYVGTDKVIVCWIRVRHSTVMDYTVVEEMETAIGYIEGHGVVEGTISIGDCAIRLESIDRIYPMIER